MHHLIEYSNKYFTSLGEERFSPIIIASATIALEYSNLVYTRKNNKPLFFCFPEKQSAALWLSVSMLLNFYYEDHIENETVEQVFKKGDKVKIYNTIAQIQNITKGNIVLRFKDQDGFYLKNKYRPQLSKVNAKRSLNKITLYKKKSKKYKAQRNPISKILEPNDSIIINQNNLRSRVLVISGRGYGKCLRESLHVTTIFGETLNTIFPEDNNLIIKPDLEPYVNIFDSAIEAKVNHFIAAFKSIYKDNDIPKIRERMCGFISQLKPLAVRSREFYDQFQELISDCEDLEPKLKFLKDLYPGLADLDTENLRAVIINDISQVEVYEKTISSFLKIGIPVIVTSNRFLETRSQMNLYDAIFKRNPDSLRVNWSKGKIKVLQKLVGNNEKFIDQKLWDICKRYAEQKVEIQIFKSNRLDKAIPELLYHIRSLESFETLQKSFYRYLYPALYAIKNSQFKNNQVEELILRFEQDFNQIKNHGLGEEIKLLLSEVVDIAHSFVKNSKNIPLDENVFAYNITRLNEEKVFCPVEYCKNNLPTSDFDEITFTGYPFNEYSNQYLLRSVSKDFIPKVKVLCWPYEADLTLKYIRKRLMCSYFVDNLKGMDLITGQYSLLRESDFRKEINSYVIEKGSQVFESSIDQEVAIEELNDFKYKGYSNTSEINGSFLVNCDIINFLDGTFMFVPKGGRVLSECDSRNGRTIVKNAEFKDLFIGGKVFLYRKDRSVYREIAKYNQEVKLAYNQLRLWRLSLLSTFKNLDHDLSKLQKLLKKTQEHYNLKSGNPSKNNIHRWLYDDELIAPDSENIKIILLAANTENVDEQIKKINHAYKIVVAHTISLGSKLKKYIGEQLSGMNVSEGKIFNIKLEEVEIKIESRTIAALESSNLEIDYHNTRKILC